MKRNLCGCGKKKLKSHGACSDCSRRSAEMHQSDLEQVMLAVVSELRALRHIREKELSATNAGEGVLRLTRQQRETAENRSAWALKRTI